MKNKIILIGIVAIAVLASCEAVKKCCSKDKCKTEKATEGVCNKCGKNSCSSSCSSKISSDTLKIK